MKAKILELNNTDAFVSLENGSKINISLDELAPIYNVGDTLNLNFTTQSSISPNTLLNDRISNKKSFDFI